MNKKKIKLLELFAGYGSQHLALTRMGLDVEADISEIYDYAIQAYNNLHGETNNLGDITTIDEKILSDYNLITYSFPCTDISSAGKQMGLSKNSGTRSSLLWECERIIRQVKPKYLLLENVKNLVGKKFKSDFNDWLSILDDLGYNNYTKVLNSKDFNVPQSRERVFVVSIRKDINQTFEFPIGCEMSKKFRDVLESVEDESFYLTEKQIKARLSSTFNSRQSLLQKKDYCDTLAARDYKEPKYFDSLSTPYENKSSYRNLTPKEYFRLMGLTDEEFGRLSKNLSKTRLYNLAGNSIVVDVLEAIFRKLIKE